MPLQNFIRNHRNVVQKYRASFSLWQNENHASSTIRRKLADYAPNSYCRGEEEAVTRDGMNRNHRNIQLDKCEVRFYFTNR